MSYRRFRSSTERFSVGVSKGTGGSVGFARCKASAVRRQGSSGVGVSSRLRKHPSKKGPYLSGGLVFRSSLGVGVKGRLCPQSSINKFQCTPLPSCSQPVRLRQPNKKPPAATNGQGVWVPVSKRGHTPQRLGHPWVPRNPLTSQSK